MPRNPDEIGALWIKTGARGEYMTGMINGAPVVLFRNDKKTSNQPDWRVLKSRPKGERAERVSTNTGEIGGSFEQGGSEWQSDDIPF